MYRKIWGVLFLCILFSCNDNKKDNIIGVEKNEYQKSLPLSQGLGNFLDSVKISSEVVPVLRDKSENLLLRWDFHVKSEVNSVYLRNLSFSLVGTENLEDIASLTMCYKDTTNELVNLQQKITPEQGAVLTFTHKVKLSSGLNSFVLKCKLKSTANIRNHIKIRPASMTIGGKRYDIEVPALERKFGIALLKHKQNGVDTYRIPGLITTEKGTLIAVYDRRNKSSKDLQGDIDVGMSRSEDGGQTWQESRVIIDMEEYGRKPEKLNGVGDPAVLYDKSTHTIWVAALWTHGMSEKQMAWWRSKEGMSPKETGQLVLVKSTNDGRTWSEPYNITSQVKDPKWQLLLQGPGMGISVVDSLLVFPAQFKAAISEKSMDGGKYTPFSTIIYSKDHGKTWTIGTGAKSNTTEAQVIALNDGSLMLNMRDDRNRRDTTETNGRAVAVTSDLGKTWTSHPTSNSALIEPNCMASLIKETFLIQGEKKTIVLFSNPNSKLKRNNMSIKISYDDAQTWEEANTTLIDAGEGRGYSCLTKVDDEHIGILYEGSGADLVFQVFHIDELVKK